MDSLESNTVVITTVDVLKSAFLEWADEREHERQKAAKEIMIDEAEVLMRLAMER